MPPSKPWGIGIAAVLWTAGAATGVAAEPVFRTPAMGDRLRANESSTVSWSIDSDALAERDEMELVLSLDGGATFPIRVTGELSTTSRSVAWRVPALATERAVLALRAGEDGADASETVLAVSEPFAIVADPETAPEPLYPVADEWRTGDALDGAPVRTPSRDLASTDGGTALSSIDGDADETETPPAGDALVAAEESGSIAKAPTPCRPPTPLRLAAALPLPLRL